MTSTAGADPTAVDSAWDAHRGGTPPLGHLLRTGHPDCWVRFHSLPDSKRYADTEPEYAILLGRLHTILDELSAPAELLVITCEWSDDPSPLRRQPDLEAAAPGDHWRTVLEDETEEAEFRTYTHLYVGTLANQPAALDPLLRMVSDFQTAGVVLAPADFRWLVHPYDGGVDVIAASLGERDALRARHTDWLSRHPGGM